ncbi:MAG: ParB/RepB/Spo0J family partition protein [Lachnospiraceae bacterium]|nr:ParB/RepB/Spo0J family partition protein [Lachnospiraceae bacterium]
MAAKKGGLGKGLGKGLDVLIQANDEVLETITPQEINKTGETILKINDIEPNREQPRKVFNEDALEELSESIKEHGIIQPLLVQKEKDYYKIIAGERRWRAAKKAGLKEVPVIIKDYTEQQIVEISLIENIQREDLNPIEEAMAYKKLSEEFRLKQDEVAERVSKSRVAITNSMRLLKLDERVQGLLIEDMISTGHARALLAITDKEEQYNMAMRIFDEKISVRETEKMVQAYNNPKVPKKKENSISESEQIVYQNIEENLKEIFGTKVSIQRKTKDKGKLEIEYYSSEELERIIELLESVRGERN